MKRIALDRTIQGTTSENMVAMMKNFSEGMVEDFAKVIFLQASSMTGWKTFTKKLAGTYVDEIKPTSSNNKR